METVVCYSCGKNFKARACKHRKYCSHSCYADSLKKLTGSKHHRFTKVTLICKICGKEYKQTKCREKTSVACSSKCYGVWRSKVYRGVNHPQWRGGKETNYTWKKEWRELRKYILRRDKFHCQICGQNDGSKLEIHHIISYQDSKSDLFLTTLCKRCHAKVHRELNHNKPYLVTHPIL